MSRNYQLVELPDATVMKKIALVFQYLKKFIDVQERPMKRVGYKRKDEQE